jgi:glycerol-3-phosphate acyltransferase PlsY
MIAIYLLGAYLVGSIPFDAWLLKKLKGLNIKRAGSGNPGATNLLRLAGWSGFFWSFLFDALKGGAPVWLGYHYGLPLWAVTALGLAAILGHLFPVLAKFQGGKGVSTTSGVFMVFNPVAGLVAFLVWLVIVNTTRLSSVGSISATAIAVIAQFAVPTPWKIQGWPVTIFIVLMLVVILITHSGNICRLKAHQENKISW